MSKIILKKLLLSTLIATSSISAFAGKPVFQVAIVKDAVASNDIVKGDVESGLKKLTTRAKSNNSYDKKMGLCVAYLQSNNSQASESACTNAIYSIDELALYTKKALYLKSLNYSNRGVSRYKNADFDGALSDFSTAVAIDNNATTENNLAFIRQIMSDMKVENTAPLSD